MAIIAIAGGTGGLGSNVVKGCAASPKHKVIVVQRSSSSTPDWLKSLKNVEVRRADYDSADSLVAALQGADTVLCTFTVADGTWAQVQIRVLHAAIAAGAKRFTPCDWGNGVPNYSRVDILASQPVVWEACRAAVADAKRSGRQFEWAGFHPGGFMNYLGIGAGDEAATAGLKGSADLIWNVEEMKATLPLTKDGQAPTITLTELSDIGKAVCVACELPFGQWQEEMGIAGDVIAIDKVVQIVEKVRSPRKMEVERMPFDQVQKRALEAQDIFEKMWCQLYEAFARELKGECVFEANVNSLEGVGKLQTVEQFVTKYWTGK